MAFTTHHVLIRGRLTNVAPDNPALLATAASSVAEIDSLAINGVDADMRKFTGGELSAIKSAIKQFVVDKLDFNVGSPSFTGAGNGTLVVNSYNALAAVVETWTVTMLTATTYTVVGTVTGSTSNGNTAVAAGVYDNGILNFTVTPGVTPFEAGDAWTIAVTY
jgi:hypothetical protein